MGEPPLVALTGSTGFIGRHLLRSLPASGYRVRVLLRRPGEIPPEASGAVVGDLAAPRNMSAALAGVDAVIHSAGLAHARSGHPEDDFRIINTQGTVALGRAAQRAGVRRFVFLSSIRAQVGASHPEPVDESMAPAPTDPYGRSKLEAEEGLGALGLDFVALRPVLVYGPGVKGNMAALLRLARSPWPLPLASLGAPRSILSLDNLAAAIETVLRPGPAVNGPLIVADPEPLTVGEMIAAMREGLGRQAGLLPCPPPLLAAMFNALGRGEDFARLSGRLVARPDALIRLGWAPPIAPRSGLAALAAAFAREARPEPAA